MPKLKSHSGAKKRLRVTATGKFKARSSGRSHNLSHKAHNRMRRLEKGVVLSSVETRRIKILLPHA